MYEPYMFRIICDRNWDGHDAHDVHRGLLHSTRRLQQSVRLVENAGSCSLSYREDLILTDCDSTAKKMDGLGVVAAKKETTDVTRLSFC